VGGTFDRFHRAHRALLDVAGASGESLLVGITSDKMAASDRKGERLQPYSERARVVAGYLNAQGKRYRIVRLNDKHGPAVFGEYDAIVVSSNTRPTAEHINRIRKRKGLKPLAVVEIGTVLAEDGLPISSTHIRKGEMDQEGRMKRLRVVVGSTNPVKVEAARSVFGRAFPGRKLEVHGIRVESSVPSEPYGKDVINGALQRAQSAIDEADAHLGVGIEAGLFWCEHLQDYIDVQYCAIVDRGERMTLGHGPGFQYPPPIMSKVKEGKTVGQAMADISGISGIGRKQGVVGYLSKGIMVRKGLTETAIIAAMLPRLNPKLYFLD
jgi:inosine/xanthosine triphosphatase